MKIDCLCALASSLNDAPRERDTLSTRKGGQSKTISSRPKLDIGSGSLTCKYI